MPSSGTLSAFFFSNVNKCFARSFLSLFFSRLLMLCCPSLLVGSTKLRCVRNFATGVQADYRNEADA